MSLEDDGQSSGTSNDNYHSEEFQSLPNSDDERDTNSKIVYHQCNPRSCFGQVHLKVGMEFNTINMFVEVVRDYTIFNGKDLKWVKVDTIRVRARYKQIGCPWENFCSRSEVTRSFQIKTFLEEHIVEGSSKINKLQ